MTVYLWWNETQETTVRYPTMCNSDHKIRSHLVASKHVVPHSTPGPFSPFGRLGDTFQHVLRLDWAQSRSLLLSEIWNVNKLALQEVHARAARDESLPTGGCRRVMV